MCCRVVFNDTFNLNWILWKLLTWVELDVEMRLCDLYGDFSVILKEIRLFLSWNVMNILENVSTIVHEQAGEESCEEFVKELSQTKL